LFGGVREHDEFNALAAPLFALAGDVLEMAAALAFWQCGLIMKILIMKVIVW
jgi:hypothetical protein